MLYDLNIAWSSSTSASELSRTLKFSSSLGYNVVALNHILNATGAPIPAQIVNPLPKFSLPALEFNAKSKTSDANFEHPEVLHRATVIYTDPGITYRFPQIVQAYDIVAVRPQGEKAFNAACLNSTEPSLISLDMTQFLGFHFKPKPCMAAVNRGLRFEICYSQFLMADNRGRATFIGNVMNLVRTTRGRGIVVSSEAKKTMGLRGPADVVNLLAVWGLAAEKGSEGMRVNPRGVVVNEGIKRSGFRGVIDIVSVAEREDGDKMEGVEQESAIGKGKETGDANGSGKKRKENETASGEMSMSKRQAKKMKKLAVMEGKPEDKT